MQYITGKRARSLVERKNALLIDVRDPVDYRNGSLPNAKNLPLRNLVNELVSLKDKRVPLILFGATDDNTLNMAERYADNFGFTVYGLRNVSDWFDD